MSNKEERLMRYLSETNSITSIEAIEQLGDTRLAATICELRKKGVNIGDRWLESKNRWGETVRYKEYFIVTDETIDGVKYVASELF